MKLTRNLLIAEIPSMMLASLLALRVGAADRTSNFDASAEDWRTSDAAATITWQASGGTPGGYLNGTGIPGTDLWYFVSPAAWAGDWSGYKVLKFDFSIPTRHYPDLDRAGMVVIIGANGQQMTWTASTPLWTWTHYEVSLKPSAFGADQATYDAIITNVVELRILAEFSTATEAVGLDNVLLSISPPQAMANLVSRFTDGTTQGWRPIDDVSLSVSPDMGRPTFGLFANDWMDGRYYKVATPTNWAGDWSSFEQLSFDMWWSGSASYQTNRELVRIFGGNGQILSWSNNVISGVWTNRVIPLIPETFGVTAAQFEGVLAHVSEMWIFGEFGGGDDLTYLDNIVLTANTNPPPPHTHNLISRFESDAEAWNVIDNGTMTWLPNGGFSGGGLRFVDAGSGTGRFETPEAWSGDWRNFRTLSFMIKPNTAGRSTYVMVLWIVTHDDRQLRVDLPYVPGSWTPFTVDLAPETFGVSAAEFDTVITNVAGAWIRAEIGTGSDTSYLDNVALLTETGAGLPPDRFSDFESGTQGWRKGNLQITTGAMTFGGTPTHSASGGNPNGHIRNSDDYDITAWFSPESWAGDWRGIESVSFDFKIITGSNPSSSWMLSIVSPWTNLLATVASPPVPGQWCHYEFAISPDLFGVPEDVLNHTLRDTVALSIRSEWISGGEVEGLDNVRITKASDAYWAWVGDYFSGADLADEQIAGKVADPDGDNMSNWNEFIAGTVPTNRLDLLRIEHVAVTNATCLLDFHSRTGRLYDVEGVPALSSTTTWNTVANDIPGTGLLQTVPVSAGSSPQFYRLKVR